MHSPEQLLSGQVAAAIKDLFGTSIDTASVTFQKTNPQFEGDITLVVFPYVKLAGKGPEQTGQLIGEYLQKNVPEVSAWNVVKGFLNLVISTKYWLEAFDGLKRDENWGKKPVVKGSPFVMVEYSSPNTNKPLHLGHVRNILLGHSV
ncbi:MAG TPA: arginine--tRNA ligase, partial [Bacteroidia bacterium]|nr:arginine--tRNA ligase [Bacteroidia bacterium]